MTMSAKVLDAISLFSCLFIEFDDTSDSFKIPLTNCARVCLRFFLAVLVEIIDSNRLTLFDLIVIRFVIL